jgi:hypothetical protein
LQNSPEDSLPVQHRHPNQCAIRMGTAFVGAKAVTCDYHPKSMGHTLRALEFAEGLQRGLFSNIGTTEVYKVGHPWLTKLAGRTGVVFFHNYYNRQGNDTGPLTGDHIDFWKMGELTNRHYTYQVTALGGGISRKEKSGFGK